MPIHLSCPRCQRAMRINDRFAGRSVKCPGCATVLTAPAAAPEPDPGLFNFGGASPTVGSGGEFDFDVPSSAPENERFSAIAGPEIEGWRTTRAGLDMIWLGSGLQALTVTVWLVALIILGSGAKVLSTSRPDEPAPVTPPKAYKVAGVAANAIALATLATGTVIRLIGFFRFLATPAACGAKGWAISALCCEVLLLVSWAIWIPTVFLGALFIGTLASLASPVLWLTGLVLILFYLHQIGVALNSKALCGKVMNFIIWLSGGAVASAAITFFCLFLLRKAALGQPSAGKGMAALAGSCFTIIFLVSAVLTVLVKYLGLFTTASDEIKRRVGE